MSTGYEDDDSSQSGDVENSIGRRIGLRERPRKAQMKSQLRLRKMIDDYDNFLGDFDPEKSTRERRKLSRKTSAPPPPQKCTMYDERGRLRDYNSTDICDCMHEKCPGCFFACANCGNPKCGPTCRINRRHTYETIEFDGKDIIIRNKYHNRN
ncbi:unnamed protein product [Hermetia illucens]|uniref:ARF7 effector protein C-terminal domain-containing protein n=1 Tax=Hermetia illucens TaxID=343691 RepID=A0A7R8U9X8_HERIL|nr:ARL14 effector protein [Hermetia illucens]CAD7076862.1 unnamed protein product [Hermetia illucens]